MLLTYRKAQNLLSLARYHQSLEKTRMMKEEAQYLLQYEGLAIPIYSPWASPSLLVPESDLGFVMSTDS